MFLDFVIASIWPHLISWKVWQYGLWSFQAGGTKLEIFLYKNQYSYPKEIIEFSVLGNGKLSEIGHPFSIK